MRYRFRRRRSTVNAVTDIPLTPLIDTALTLLVIFMVASPMMHNSIVVQLPKGEAQEARAAQDKELTVTVDKQGAILFNEKTFTAKQLDVLVKEIHAVMGNKTDQTVYLYADSTVSYGLVIELVDYLKMVGGVHYVALATEKRTA